MNSSDIYVKTPQGEEAMTQRTRVVQRSQRMVLILVDGKTRVAELGAKIGDARLTETALKELEAGGFIALSGVQAAEAPVLADRPLVTPSQLSRLSTFGPKSAQAAASPGAATVMPSSFSTFARPPLVKAAPASPGAHEVNPEMPEKADVRPEPRFPVGKLMAGALGLGVLAIVAGIFLYPYDHHRASFEAKLSRQLGVPVKIGEIGPRFMPGPMLELGNLRLGQEGQGRIEKLRLPGLWSHLRNQEMDRNDVIEIHGARLPMEYLSRWWAKRDPGAPARIQVRQLELLMGARSLAVLDGEIQRKTDGSLQQALLHSADRSVRLEVAPQGKELGINFEASAWKPQPDSPVTFVFASAKGILQEHSLRLNSVDLRFLDGRYEGDLLIDWGAGQGMAGSGTLHRINTSSLAALWVPQLKMSGELSGSLRFRAQGNSPEDLLADLEAEGNWRVEHGEIRATDLANAVRLGRGRVARGGITRFERLTTDVRLAPSGIRFSNIQMAAGLMQAQGYLDVDAAGDFRGRLEVFLSRSTGGGGTLVKLGGRLPNLEASIQ